MEVSEVRDDVVPQITVVYCTTDIAEVLAHEFCENDHGFELANGHVIDVESCYPVLYYQTDINKDHIDQCNAKKNVPALDMVVQDYKRNLMIYGADENTRGLLFLGAVSNEIDLVDKIREHTNWCGEEHAHWIFFEKSRHGLATENS